MLPGSGIEILAIGTRFLPFLSELDLHANRRGSKGVEGGRRGPKGIIGDPRRS
jgi:hypothetical protein